MTKAYLVIGQKNEAIDPVAIFAKEGDAELSARSHTTGENEYWVEEINYYE